jgi:hypothetical protein
MGALGGCGCSGGIQSVGHVGPDGLGHVNPDGLGQAENTWTVTPALVLVVAGAAGLGFVLAPKRHRRLGAGLGALLAIVAPVLTGGLPLGVAKG